MTIEELEYIPDFGDPNSQAAQDLRGKVVIEVIVFPLLGDELYAILRCCNSSCSVGINRFQLIGFLLFCWEKFVYCWFF